MLSKRNKHEPGQKNRPDGSAEPVPEWCDAKPAVIPPPTAWPMVLALAATIGLWGILTSWVFVVVGLLLCALSIFQWIQELRK